MRRVLVLPAAGVVVCVLGLSAVVSAWTQASPSHAAVATRSACATKLLPPAAPASQIVHWGHIKSVIRKGSRYELRFDPALWLTGITAERAAVADGVLQPGQPVPNDYYVVDERHRLFTYLVPLTARATVLVNGPCATSIGIPELAQIVKGRNPRHRKLYDRGNNLGYWLRVRIDTVRTLDQQYQP